MTTLSTNQRAGTALSSGHAQRQPLRKLEDLLQDVATLTGLPLAQLQTQVGDLEFPMYEFQGMVLVSPNITDPLIDHWTEQIKTKLRSGQSTSVSKPSRRQRSKAAAPPTSAAEPTPAEPKTGKETASPRKGLRLPKGYSQLVSNRYEPTLEKLLPQNPEDRQDYLKEIVAESERGKDFLMRVATAIQKKYKGRTTRGTAYRGLLDRARAVWEGMIVSNGRVEQVEQAAEI